MIALTYKTLSELPMPTEWTHQMRLVFTYRGEIIQSLPWRTIEPEHLTVITDADVADREAKRAINPDLEPLREPGIYYDYDAYFASDAERTRFDEAWIIDDGVSAKHVFAKTRTFGGGKPLRIAAGTIVFDQ